MSWITFFSIFVLFTFTGATSNRGFGPGKQDYGYVTVRDRAHMFWWLYHTTANVTDSTERPLIMWLQGGPGGSSCGYGNFEIIGPLDLDLKPRNSTWVNDFNVLFVDNPVGTGYSYVESLTLLTKDNKEIARDLVTLMKSFYDKFPQFKKTPFYVYGQSYGGKMALDFVKLLNEEVIAGKIQSNISGVAMGNAWISPVDSTLSWAPFLYQVSLIDEKGLQEVMVEANYTKKFFDEGKYKESTAQWAYTENVILRVTDGVDFYNILTKTKRSNQKNNRNFMEKVIDKLTYSKYYNERAYDLHELMNGPVKEALNIPKNVIWGSQANPVFIALDVDFMKPVLDVAEDLLNNTNIKVHVYNGNVDLIVDTPGQMIWVDKLRWRDRNAYLTAPRKTIWVNNVMEGYEKTGGKFTFFWINVAGHSVPAENPAGTRWFLKSMTGV